MSIRRFAKSRDAKKAGWHSCRHQTREAQDAARETYQQNRGRNARRRRALERGACLCNQAGCPHT